jgi:hypothetical protein
VPVPCCVYCYGSVAQFEARYCDTSSIHASHFSLYYECTIMCLEYCFK